MKATNSSSLDKKMSITGQKLKFYWVQNLIKGNLKRQIEPGRTEKLVRPYGFNQDYII